MSTSPSITSKRVPKPELRKPQPKPEAQKTARPDEVQKKDATAKREDTQVKKASTSTDDMLLPVPLTRLAKTPPNPVAEILVKGQIEVKETRTGKATDQERAERHVRETLKTGGVEASDEVVRKVAQTVGPGDTSEPKQPQFNQFEYEDKLSLGYQKKVLEETQKEKVAELYEKQVSDKLAAPSAPELLDPSSPADTVVGEGKKFPKGVTRGYTVAVPSDGDMAPRDLMKQTVADVLRRNNRAITDADLEKITDSMKSADGSYDFSATQEGTQTPERTTRMGPNLRPFDGYGLKLDMEFQKKVLDKTSLIAGPAADAPKEEKVARMKELVSIMKHAPDFLGQPGAKEALTALEQNLEKGDGADWNQAGIPSAIKAICEYAQKIPGSPAYKAAGELMGRVGGAFKLVGDAKSLADNFGKLVTGLDSKTGEKLSREQLVDAAIGLVESGIDVAGDAADLAAVSTWLAPGTKLATLGGAAAEKMATFAPPAAAILFWVKMNWEVVKLGREAINGVAHYEMNRRFPTSTEGGNWQSEMEAQQQRIDALPTSPNNAELTTRRILNSTFQDIDTRDRFIKLLSREVSRDTLIRIIEGKDPCLTPEESVRVATAAKRVAQQFMDLELAEVKNHPLQRPRAGSDYLTRDELRR